MNRRGLQAVHSPVYGLAAVEPRGTRDPGLVRAMQALSQLRECEGGTNGGLFAERDERAVALRPRGNVQPDVVVIGIRVLVAVEHGLLSETLEQRRPKHGDRQLERLRLSWLEAAAREGHVTELRAPLGNPALRV